MLMALPALAMTSKPSTNSAMMRKMRHESWASGIWVFLRGIGEGSESHVLLLLFPLSILPLVITCQRLAASQRLNFQAREMQRSDVVIEKRLGGDRNDRLDEGEHGIGII